jgi:PAS domain S-box-containing protein
MQQKPSYQELEAELAKVKKQNELFRLHFSASEDGKVNYYNSILNNMGDPVFVKDNQSRILIVNDAFCELFSLSRGDIIGKTLAEDVSPEERAVFLSIDKQVLKSGLENINEESLTVRGGETRIILTRKTLFVDGQGNKFLIGVIRDITERHNAEKALNESESRLKDLNRTKDKLFSIIAHDLRNPFHSILTLSELLIDSPEVSEEDDAKSYATLINSTASNTLVLLDNLLSWAKSQMGQTQFNPERIDLSKSIKEAIDISSSQAKLKRISIISSDLIVSQVYADKNMLKTILLNLISNAIKFTNTSGFVELSVIENKTQLEVLVSDNGIGISDEKLETLLDLSSNSSSYGTQNEKGTGIGLLLCKEFVEKQGGKIWVKSEEGKGSEFRFTLQKA